MKLFTMVLMGASLFSASACIAGPSQKFKDQVAAEIANDRRQEQMAIQYMREAYARPEKSSEALAQERLQRIRGEYLDILTPCTSYDYCKDHTQ